MATPAMLVSTVLKLMVVSVGIFWSVSFAVSRFFVFYEAYTGFLALLRDEEWLRTQCMHPEFYSNLRQHTELCDTVRLNADRSPFLIALNAVANTAHLCGRQSCAEVLAGMSWPAVAAAVAVGLMAPSLLVRIVRGLAFERQLPVYYHDGGRHVKCV